MKNKNPLFLLIKSLTRSEKRYFRVFTDTDKRYNNYLKLFDTIEKQEVYNESAIKRKFKDEKFIKQLHVTKSYLRRLIYKSNRNFHSKNSELAKVRSYLTNVEILFNKELFIHCKKELQKAERAAGKYELLSYLFEIYEWKRKLEQHVNPHNYSKFKKILEDQTSALDRLNNQNKYLHLIVDVSRNVRDGKPGVVENEKLLLDEQNALSLDAKVMHYNARYFRNIQKRDTVNGEEDLLKLIQYFDKNPDWMSSRPGTYIATINNLVTYYIFSKKFGEALKLIQKAKNVYYTINPTSENKSLLKQILRTYNIELEVYRDQHLYKDDPGYIESIENFVSKYQFKMPKEYLISFWFQLANIRFMQNDNHNALKWVNEIIQMNFRDVREDIQIQARFLNLLVHLEQRNMFVLRYFVDSTRRFVKKRKKVEPYEKVLLSFFSKMGRIPESEFRTECEKLNQKLFPKGQAGPMEANQLDYVDYGEWLKEKLS